MKKLIITAALLMAATSAFGMAASNGTHSIVNTPHDLVKNWGVAQTGPKQLCIFCHTPHNPLKAIPLWNRNNGVTITVYYNTSPSLTSTARNNTALYPDSISMFCMSCHDGATALGAIKNTADTGIAGIEAGGAADTTKIAAGRKALIASLGSNDLSNSHPIGFDYVAAQAEDNGARLNRTDSTVFQAAFGVIPPLFKANNGSRSNQVECASCHKVHDNFYPPFLRASNTNSGLCLACHNK